MVCGLGLGCLVWVGLGSDLAKRMIEQDKSDNSWSFWALECPFWGLKNAFKRRVLRCQGRTGITYNEIQSPRPRYGLIDFENLTTLLNFNGTDDLRDSYRGWVKKALQEEVSQHEGKWTESIATCPVKSGCFI